MGVEYYYGNTKTLEFIDMGKGPLWTNLFYDLMRGEIDLSLVKDYIREQYHVENADADYTEWVAKNVHSFFEKAGENLIYVFDGESITFLDGKTMANDDIEPPFYTSEHLIVTNERNPWRKVWDRYIRCHTDYMRKNI